MSGAPVWLPEWLHRSFAEATLLADGQVGEGVGAALDARLNEHVRRDCARQRENTRGNLMSRGGGTVTALSTIVGRL